MNINSIEREKAQESRSIYVAVLHTIHELWVVFLVLGVFLTWWLVFNTPRLSSAQESEDPSSNAPSVLAPVPTSSVVPVRTGTDGYLTQYQELKDRKVLADQGIEPYKSAQNAFLAWLQGDLPRQIQNHHAPSPHEPLNISGTEGSFVFDSNTAYDLALAWVLTGNTTHANQARAFINAWVATTKTTRHTCPNDGSCQTSLVISRAAPSFVFAADLIKPSGVWSVADDTAFKDWLRTVILPAASERTNNWGDAGTFMRVVVTDYLGDTAGFSAVIEQWKSMVRLIANDGSIPEETRRKKHGINYSQEALDYKLAVALIAQRRGIDLWKYGRLQKATRYLSPFIQNPSLWPWAHVTDHNVNVHPLWELAYQHWGWSRYQHIVQLQRPWDGSDWHSAVRWTTLTNGVL